MKDFDRISIDPSIMNGQPCIRGTRLTIKRVLLAISMCSNREELQKDYPQLQDEDIRQALAYAAANLADEIDDLRTAS